MIYNSRKIGALVAASCLATSAQAADIQWSGFGTIGMGQTLNNSDAKYRTNAIAGSSGDKNGNLDDKLGFDALSLVALQANANLQDGLSATVQILAEGADDWETRISWAYLSYDLTPILKVQAGRKLLPIYALTDSIDIGYTYHWIRPPADVYSVAANRYDGANLTYQNFHGDFEVRVNGLFGRVNDEDDLFGDAAPASYRVFGGEVETTFDDWATTRFAAITYENFELGFELSPGLTLPEFNADYYAAAIVLRPGNWFIIGEYTWFRVDQPGLDFGMGPIPNTQTVNNLDAAWYVSGAYTMGRWTPHITFSKEDFQNQNGAGLVAIGAGGSVVNSSTVIVGVRYDFHPSASVKMEYHYFTDDTTLGGVETPGLGNRNDQTDVVQVAVDFIF